MHMLAALLLAGGLGLPQGPRSLDRDAIQSAAHAVVRLDSAVTTRTARVGDPVRLRTASALIIGGVPVPVGSDVQGVVSRARRPGRIRGRAEIELTIVSITLDEGTQLPVTARSGLLEPLSGAASPPRAIPPPAPTLPIVAGMAAGYGVAGVVSRWSNSEDTVVNAGALAGLATGVLVGVLKRGDDLVLAPGTTIDILFENSAESAPRRRATIRGSSDQIAENLRRTTRFPPSSSSISSCVAPGGSVPSGRRLAACPCAISDSTNAASSSLFGVLAAPPLRAGGCAAGLRRLAMRPPPIVTRRGTGRAAASAGRRPTQSDASRAMAGDRAMTRPPRRRAQAARS
jgi:hypothetical protein